MPEYLEDYFIENYLSKWKNSLDKQVASEFSLVRYKDEDTHLRLRIFSSSESINPTLIAT
ncbi:hypothetical protein OENI_400002 [Oenococcus oeni]|nr:hypothetical protein OENI_400002 [Oenococcus oeni]